MINGVRSTSAYFRTTFWLVIAALLALVPGVSPAESLQITVGATGQIVLDPPDANDPPHVPLATTFLIDEADVEPTSYFGIGSHYDLGGGAVLRSAEEQEAAFESATQMGLDTFLAPPAPGVDPYYDVILYVQTFATPGLSAPLPGVTLPAQVFGLEVWFRLPVQDLLPADTTVADLFLGPLAEGLVAQTITLRGEFNPSFTFSAPIDSFEASAVPEPAAALLAAFGLALALAARRRR